jgi:enamine deaminase RidA (YjgF/YER057c/UK114 family)
MNRETFNPWSWQDQFGYSQSVSVSDSTVTLYCAGQTSVNANGTPIHVADMGAQIAQALDNIDAVLAASGFGWEHVVRLDMYTTDVDQFLANYGVLMTRLSHTPASTLLGVERLAYPELLVELEATAVR